MRVLKIKNEGVGKLYTDYELDCNDKHCFMEDWGFKEEEATKLCDYMKANNQKVKAFYTGIKGISFILSDTSFEKKDAPTKVVAMLETIAAKEIKPIIVNKKNKKAKEEDRTNGIDASTNIKVGNIYMTDEH